MYTSIEKRREIYKIHDEKKEKNFFIKITAFLLLFRMILHTSLNIV